MVKLKSFGFKGIKNMDTYTEIDFISKKQLTNEELENNFIKAIYGPNGSGKTALVKAMIFYKYLVLKDNFLIKHDDYLKSYINNNVEEVIFKMTYLCESSSKKAKEVIHEIHINKNLDIIYEKINMQSNIIEIKLGEMKKLKLGGKKVLSEENRKFIIDETKNLLNKSSFVSISLKKNQIITTIDVGFDIMLSSILFTMYRSSIIIEDKDEVFLEDVMKVIDSFEEVKDKVEKNLKVNRNILDVNRVLKEEKESYEKLWSKIKSFLQIVKPQVQGINIDYKVDGEEFIPQVSIDYGTYKVNVEFESVGIKKLINLYEYVRRLVNNDSILIIDELDAHLHDVLITKLIEYIINNERGQFIFTIHNLSAMDELKNKSDSISILDLNKHIVNWKKSGNASPKNAYKLGYLTDDFGYGLFDLDEVFAEGEK